MFLPKRAFQSPNHIGSLVQLVVQVDDGLLIEENPSRHDAILEFLSGCDVDVAQDGAGELGEEVGGVEKLEEFDEFATAMTVPNQGMALALAIQELNARSPFRWARRGRRRCPTGRGCRC
jgi:hypothetical protein